MTAAWPYPTISGRPGTRSILAAGPVSTPSGSTWTSPTTSTAGSRTTARSRSRPTARPARSRATTGPRSAAATACSTSSIRPTAAGFTTPIRTAPSSASTRSSAWPGRSGPGPPRAGRPTGSTGPRRSSVSPHNGRIVYLGAQVLLRSLDRGDNWREISPDLTTNDPKKLAGNIEFCTLTSISESPLEPGIIWTGSDDGKVQLTRNGGGTWKDLTANLAAAGCPAELLRHPRLRLGPRGRHGLRHQGRLAPRRLPAVRLPDRGLRRDLDLHRSGPPRRHGLRRRRGPAESASPLHRRGIRRLRLDRRRPFLAPVRQRPAAERPRPRPPRPSPRQRPRRGHPWPRPLRRRRHRPPADGRTVLRR